MSKKLYRQCTNLEAGGIGDHKTSYEAWAEIWKKKKKTKTCMDKEYKIRALLKLEMPKKRSKI